MVWVQGRQKGGRGGDGQYLLAVGREGSGNRPNFRVMRHSKSSRLSG